MHRLMEMRGLRLAFNDGRPGVVWSGGDLMNANTRQSCPQDETSLSMTIRRHACTYRYLSSRGPRLYALDPLVCKHHDKCKQPLAGRPASRHDIGALGVGAQHPLTAVLINQATPQTPLYDKAHDLNNRLHATIFSTHFALLLLQYYYY